jgi:hypothetical protein
MIQDQLIHIAETLRICSPTLKDFRFGTAEDVWDGSRHALKLEEDGQDYPFLRDRLRVEWQSLVAVVSSCRELEVLMLPPIVHEPLFPPGTSFDRLTQLEICDHERGHPSDAGVMGLWELMASGGLPALAKLKVRFEGRCGGVEDVTARVVPAFEAVAGTLTHLCLEKYQNCAWVSDDVDIGYAFGMALCKLRRLEELALGLSEGGRAYHTVAQGLAVSGEEHPLPLLGRVSLLQEIKTDADLVTSLLLPGVRVFSSCGVLLTVCSAPSGVQANMDHVAADEGTSQSFRYIRPRG